MRKGTVMIICKNEKQYNHIIIKFSDCFKKHINGRIIKCKNDCKFFINGYQLLIRTSYNINERGQRPEIIYIDKNSHISINAIEISIMSSLVWSNRIEPLRILDLDDILSIDYKELIDDNYARNEKCDKEALERWKEMIEKI